ncbi:DUF2269 domain-containing protein [Catellatospora coxensis]|uniref:DUF2269 domain-containing protein n=1 Tax=Catellatospora coxensis TaxID=310354 RepID=A0A8J3P748_9ACTN|nr:DUF2269 domain-containing protein [Catellatospora coxensis]GIG06227.1 hypothetical protein Cco03nite_29270 [Catellatospora coxensis]
MPPRLRKTALVAHVSTSIGWLGAVAAFLAIAVAGLTTTDGDRAHALYLAGDLVTRTVIVPLAVASCATGLLQSLGTSWGLVRHWWIIAKLVLALPATGLLLLHTGPIAQLADPANTTALAAGDLRGMQTQLLADAAAAIVVLLIATALAVFKPRGRTVRGHRMALLAGVRPPAQS